MNPRPSHHTWYGNPADLVAEFDDPAALFAQLVAEPPPWRAEAACVGMPVAVFFPPPGGKVDEALQVCGRCSVRVDCLEEAIADPDLDHDVRGGMTARARAAHRRARRTRGGR